MGILTRSFRKADKRLMNQMTNFKMQLLLELNFVEYKIKQIICIFAVLVFEKKPFLLLNFGSKK